MLTVAFSLKTQMLGGNPTGLVQEEIFDLINKINKPPGSRIPVGSRVRISDEAIAKGFEDWPIQAGEIATLVTDDGTGKPYRVRTDDGTEHSHWFYLSELVAADEAEEPEVLLL